MPKRTTKSRGTAKYLPVSITAGLNLQRDQFRNQHRIALCWNVEISSRKCGYIKRFESFETYNTNQDIYYKWSFRRKRRKEKIKTFRRLRYYGPPVRYIADSHEKIELGDSRCPLACMHISTLGDGFHYNTHSLCQLLRYQIKHSYRLHCVAYREWPNRCESVSVNGHYFMRVVLMCCNVVDSITVCANDYWFYVEDAITGMR